MSAIERFDSISWFRNIYNEFCFEILFFYRNKETLSGFFRLFQGFPVVNPPEALMMISRAAEAFFGLWPHHACFYCLKRLISCLKTKKKFCLRRPVFQSTSQHPLRLSLSQSRGHDCSLICLCLVASFVSSRLSFYTFLSFSFSGRAMEASTVASKSKKRLRCPTNHHHNACSLWSKLRLNTIGFGCYNLYFLLIMFYNKIYVPISL